MVHALVWQRRVRGGFIGEISDPLALSIGADGRLRMATAAPAP